MGSVALVYLLFLNKNLVLKVYYEILHRRVTIVHQKVSRVEILFLRVIVYNLIRVVNGKVVDR